MKNKLVRFVFCLLVFFKGNSIELQFKGVKTNDFSNISVEFLQYIKNVFDLETFIETGTWTGNTTSIAAKVFSEVYSVELSKKCFLYVKNKLRDDKNIHLYHGDSPKFLQNILVKKKERILFWLDAHYSGGLTVRGDKNTPILDELKAIGESNIRDSVILIDDLRCFCSSDLHVIDETIKGYPTFKQLFMAIKGINPSYEVLVYGDCALAYIDDGISPSLALKLMTKSRMSEESDGNCLDLRFKDILDEEKEAIKKLTIVLSDVVQKSMPSLASPYKLWYSMILLGENKGREARDLLIQCLNFNYQSEKIKNFIVTCL
jgi:hypothetical protein